MKSNVKDQQVEVTTESVFRAEAAVLTQIKCVLQTPMQITPFIHSQAYECVFQIVFQIERRLGNPLNTLIERLMALSVCNLLVSCSK